MWKRNPVNNLISICGQVCEKQKSRLIVSFTGCLSSFIFQQYRNGFIEEFSRRNVIATAPGKERDCISNSAKYSKAPIILIGR